MALTIDLLNTLEQQFRQEAASKGLSLDSYLLSLLKNLATVSSAKPPRKPLSEATLLKKVNLNISESEWSLYRQLVNLRREENLSPNELEQLTALSEKIEQANAKRLHYLLALAQLRGVSLQQIKTDLGIKPVEI